MTSMDLWGPFAPGLDTGERTARLRCLRTIAHLLLGPRGDALKRAIEGAEANPIDLDLAHAALGRLASLDLRRVLATYLALLKPTAPCGGPA